MRTIIAGSRGLTDPALLDQAVLDALLFAGINPTVVLSGTAPGVDTLGEAWAAAQGLPAERYPAPWAQYPKTAGRMRNVQMSRRADALIAVWDGTSPGTRHMISLMYRLRKPYHVLNLQEKSAP